MVLIFGIGSIVKIWHQSIRDEKSICVAKVATIIEITSVSLKYLLCTRKTIEFPKQSPAIRQTTEAGVGLSSTPRTAHATEAKPATKAFVETFMY